MRKIALFIFLVTIISCNKDDITVPKVTVSEPTNKVIQGKPFSVDYKIEEENFSSANLVLLDGNNTVIDSTSANQSGTYSFTISKEVLPPLVIKVTAKDNAGNIGVGSQVLDMLSLKVNFKVKYKGTDLEYLDDYNYPVSNNAIEFSKVSFFVTNLKLDNTMVKEVSYVNIPTASKSPNSPGYKLITTNVQPGSYNKISFNIGVPPSLNAKQPNNFTSENPLSEASEYWSNWNSYIFSRIEGRIDNDDNTDLEVPFALHTGIDEALMQYSFDKNITLGDSQNGEITFVLDLYEVFNDNGTVFDIINNPQLHAPAKLPAMKNLAARINKYLKIEE